MVALKNEQISHATTRYHDFYKNNIYIYMHVYILIKKLW